MKLKKPEELLLVFCWLCIVLAAMLMAVYHGAGKLNKPVQVMECRETAENTWEWVPVRRSWAAIDLQPKTNIFSRVGVGAWDAAIVVWRQPITLHHALVQGTQHYFLTSITERNRNQLDIDAALVEAVRCTGQDFTQKIGEGNRPTEVAGPLLTFPGVLTEKYVGYQREDTHAKAEVRYVLVAPKAVSLKEGALVTVMEGPATGVYNIQARHVLDPYKNEYEMVWKRDV